MSKQTNLIRIGKPIKENPHICTFCSKECGKEYCSNECFNAFKEVLKRLMKDD